MRRNAAPRVLGPYPNRGGFRLVVVQDGCRKSLIAPSETEAQALRSELVRALAIEVRDELTLAELLVAYEQNLIEHGRMTAAQAAAHVAPLARFLGDTRVRVAALTAERAQALYRAETERVSVRTGKRIAADSHRLLLSRARSLFRFALAAGQAARDPFAGVRPTGQRRAGKPQLRIDEARAWLDAALVAARAGDALALGACLLLLLGLRSGEVLGRAVRDLDDGGRVLWIPCGKTARARRRLLIPETVRPLLIELAAARAPDALLFGAAPDGRPRARATLHKKVRALCEKAQVPRVCPHSLRGLHSTLALQAGATGDVVAASLGHASFQTTVRHYASPEAVAELGTGRVLAALRPDAQVPRVPGAQALADLPADRLAELLSDEQRAVLRRLLAE